MGHSITRAMGAITAVVLALFVTYGASWYFGLVEGNFSLLLFSSIMVNLLSTKAIFSVDCVATNGPCPMSFASPFSDFLQRLTQAHAILLRRQPGGSSSDWFRVMVR